MADWNGDGRPDLFGVCGGLQNFQLCKTRQGSQGSSVDFGLELPPNLTEVFPERPSSLGPVEARWTCVGDWYNSGKLDILISDRAVILIRNRGTRQSPLLIETENLQGTDAFVKLVNNPRPADEVYLQAVFGDWDGDGKKDLIVNQESTRKSVKQWRLYFCRNIAEDAAPRFGDPQEITFEDGSPVSIEGPTLADVDGNGKLAILFTSTNCEIRARCITWVEDSRVSLCRQAGGPLHLKPPITLIDRSGAKIPGGIQAQWADWDGDGHRGLMVLDPSPGQIRWYRNLGHANGNVPTLDVARIIRGKDLGRVHLAAPSIVDLEGNGQRDLVMSGNCESRCSGADLRIRRFPIRTSENDSLVVGDGQYIRLGREPGFEKAWDDSSGAQWLAPTLWANLKSGKPVMFVTPFRSQGNVLMCQIQGDAELGYTFAKPLVLPLTKVRGAEAAPIAYDDYDGDGRKDLWVYVNEWEKPGKIFIFPNGGTDEIPSFGEPVLLSLAGKTELKAAMPAPRLVNLDGHKQLSSAEASARNKFSGQFLLYRGDGAKPIRFTEQPRQFSIPVPQALPVPNPGQYASAAQLEAVLKLHGGPWVGSPSDNPFLYAFWAGDLSGNGGLDILLVLGHNWDQGTHLVRSETWLYRGRFK